MRKQCIDDQLWISREGCRKRMTCEGGFAQGGERVAQGRAFIRRIRALHGAALVKHGGPLEHEPARVLADGAERQVLPESARDVYGVVVAGSADDDTLSVDIAATAAIRERIAIAT